MHYIVDHPVFNTAFPLSSIVFQKLVQNQLEGGSDFNLTTKQITFSTYFKFRVFIYQIACGGVGFCISLKFLTDSAYHYNPCTKIKYMCVKENIFLLCLKDEEQHEEKEKVKKDLYAKQIQEQIKVNEIERILELERKEEESRHILEVQKQIQLDELEDYNRKRAKQKQMQCELNEINRQIERFHEMELEEAHINNLRVR